MIEWDKWEDAKCAARKGLWKTLYASHRALREDMVEDVALRLLTDGWNVRWRIVDMLRDWFGRDTRVYNFSPLFPNELAYTITPEFETYIRERLSGKPLCAPAMKTDYKIASSMEDFSRRWI